VSVCRGIQDDIVNSNLSRVYCLVPSVIMANLYLMLMCDDVYAVVLEPILGMSLDMAYIMFSML